METSNKIFVLKLHHDRKGVHNFVYGSISKKIHFSFFMCFKMTRNICLKQDNQCMGIPIKIFCLPLYFKEIFLFNKFVVTFEIKT